MIARHGRVGILSRTRRLTQSTFHSLFSFLPSNEELRDRTVTSTADSMDPGKERGGNIHDSISHTFMSKQNGTKFSILVVSISRLVV